MPESIQLLTASLLNNYRGYRDCLELRELPYISFATDVKKIARTAFINQLPEDVIIRTGCLVKSANELIPRAKTCFIHSAAIEHLLLGVKTNCYLFAMDSEKFPLDELQNIICLIAEAEDKVFTATFVTALLNGFGVGPIQRGPYGKSIKLENK